MSVSSIHISICIDSMISSSSMDAIDNNLWSLLKSSATLPFQRTHTYSSTTAAIMSSYSINITLI